MSLRNSSGIGAVSLIPVIAALIFLPYLLTTHKVETLRLLHGTIAAAGFYATARALVRDARVSSHAIAFFCFGVGGYLTFAGDFVDRKSTALTILSVGALIAAFAGALVITFRAETPRER